MTCAVPEVGVSNPHIIRNVVDFPARWDPAIRNFTLMNLEADMVGGHEFGEFLGQVGGLDDCFMSASFLLHAVCESRITSRAAAKNVNKTVLEPRWDRHELRPAPGI